MDPARMRKAASAAPVEQEAPKNADQHEEKSATSQEPQEGPSDTSRGVNDVAETARPAPVQAQPMTGELAPVLTDLLNEIPNRPKAKPAAAPDLADDQDQDVPEPQQGRPAVLKRLAVPAGIGVGLLALLLGAGRLRGPAARPAPDQAPAPSAAAPAAPAAAPRPAGLVIG